MSSTLQLKRFQNFLVSISLYLLDITKRMEQPLSFQPPFSHSSCLFKKSYNTAKVVKLKFHHVEQGPALGVTESCLTKMRLKGLIHKAFEIFLKCIAMGDGGSENCLLRIFFLSFFLLLCLQQEQSQQLYGNFDMEIFRTFMTMKLLQSSEIWILGVSSQA